MMILAPLDPTLRLLFHLQQRHLLRIFSLRWLPTRQLKYLIF